MNRKIVLMAVLAFIFAATLATHAVPTVKAEGTLLERHWVPLKKMYGGGVYKVVIAFDAGGTLARAHFYFGNSARARQYNEPTIKRIATGKAQAEYSFPVASHTL